jgi:hypothetical protein
MYQAYVDDSGRGDSKVFIDAGFSATTDQWAQFSKEWGAA